MSKDLLKLEEVNPNDIRAVADFIEYPDDLRQKLENFLADGGLEARECAIAGLVGYVHGLFCSGNQCPSRGEIQAMFLKIGVGWEFN